MFTDKGTGFRTFSLTGAAALAFASFLAVLPAQPAGAALVTFYVTQDTSLIFGAGSLNSDEASFWPAFSEFDMGPVMSQDERTNGAGFSRMAAYLNFDGLGSVEAQFSNFGTTTTRRAAFSQYLIGLFNDGTEAIPIGLMINIQPGFARIDNGGGTDDQPVSARLNVFIDANGPTFLSGDFPPFPTGQSVWEYALELRGPSTDSTTSFTTRDVLGIGVPTLVHSVVNGSVIESVSGFNGFLDFGMLEPGQKIAFTCNMVADVTGNAAGGQAKLGDPFGFISGDPAAVGNLCTPFVVPAPAAGVLFATALAAMLGRMRRRRPVPVHHTVR